MYKLLSLTMGLALGAAGGVVAVMLFAPTSGKQLADNIKQGYAEAVEAARLAGIQRRAQLEAELLEMQKGSR